MTILRAVFRSLGFLLVTVGLYTTYLVGRFFLYLLGLNPTRWRIGVVRQWARICASIIRLKIEIEGTPPNPPFFLVSNHLSYIDVLPYFITTNCVFVAKDEVRSWPMLGRMAQGINIIFIDRTIKRDIPRVNRLITQNITDQQGVIIFPEGTTSKGDRVKKFRSSLLEYAASQKFPVSYASIMYRTPEPERPAHHWVCWWGDMTFVDHFLKLLTLPSVQAVVTFGTETVEDDDRKRLAEQLHNRVKQQFRPTLNKQIKTYG